MATSISALSGFDDMRNDMSGPAWDGDQYTGAVDIVDTKPVQSVREPVAVVAEDVMNDPGNDSKELLDIRGFFVSTGAGIYEGATRDGEEPGASHFVDVQEYETGAIRRVWGIALAEVMSQAQNALSLQPGTRIHLAQRGKREMVFDSINDAKEMVIRKSFANDWVCMPDRGALPSQLAHLMSGVNVDSMLDRLALRHDMALDNQGLSAWKNSQIRIIKALGEDPQTVKGWFSRNMSFSAEDERALVAQALELEGYGAFPNRMQFEADKRMSALRSMSPDARYDYLIETAKPHLLESNKLRESQLSQEVVAAVDGFSVMALPIAAPDSPERKAMRSSLVQSIDGLSPTQQMDYLGQRRAQLVQQLAAAPLPGSPDSIIDKMAVIDATKLSRDEYQARLEEKLALASTPEERTAMLAAEIEARKLDTQNAEERLAPINAFYQKIVADRDVDMTAYLAGRLVGMLADAVVGNVLPNVKTLFQRLGGVAAWRRGSCEDGLADLRSVFAEAKAAPVYRAFENDPLVQAACAGRPPGQVLAEHADIARTEVLMNHLGAQEHAESPERAAPSPHKGLWAKAMDSAHSLSDKISHLSPEHLLKGGKIDMEWVGKMQKGLGEFAAELRETLMPEKLMAQLQEMIASILQTIKLMMEMARNLVSGKTATATASADLAP